jgi:general secretion pathway protein C
LPKDPATPTADLPSTALIGSRYRLEGVVAGVAADAQGVAFIAVGGGVPRAYRVGTIVDGNLALLGVSAGGAILGQPNGPPLIVLDMVNGGTAPGTASEPAQVSPFSAAESQALPLPATDLMPESRPTAQAPYTRAAPGRRVRLRPLNGPP